MACCGVKELCGIGYMMGEFGPVGVIKDYIRQSRSAICPAPTPYRPRVAHLIFTQASPGRYGADLAAYIIKNKLGTILQTPSQANPNSGNKVIMFLWSLDKPNLIAWARKHRV